MDPRLSELGFLRDKVTELIAESAELKARVAELEAIERRAQAIARNSIEPIAEAARHILDQT